MYSSRRSVQAVILWCSFFVFGIPAYSQSTLLTRLEAGSIRSAELPHGFRNCSASEYISKTEGLRPGPVPAGAIIDVPLGCDFSPVSPVSLVQPCSMLSVNPCVLPGKVLAHETVPTEGKVSRKILQARDRVLGILQTDNECTEWFRTKDADPAATFRTLAYEVDRKGDEYVVETRDSPFMTVFHNPYVAKVIQGNGSHSTITLNANGAFFFPMGTLVNQPKEGGPVSLAGAHLLQVGPYAGNTLQAQVLTLLHEFGHLVDLLPTDEGDREGKSVQNSLEVLRYCRAQIETKAHVTNLLTSH